MFLISNYTIMQTVKIAIEKIKPYEKNVKRHSEQQVEKIAKSIESVGFVQPLVVDENNVIIIWHWRYEAMKYLWKKEVDCVILKGLPEEKKKALRIGDNKLNESPYDISNLKDEVQDLFNLWFDLEDLGFNLKELEDFNLKIEDVSENLAEDIDFWTDESEENDDDYSWEETSYTPTQQSCNNSWTAFNYSEVQGVQSGLRSVLSFYLTEAQKEVIWDFYSTNKKWESNVELLLEVTKFYIENHQNNDESESE